MENNNCDTFGCQGIAITSKTRIPKYCFYCASCKESTALQGEAQMSAYSKAFPNPERHDQQIDSAESYTPTNEQVEKAMNEEYVPGVGEECEFSTGVSGDYKKCFIVGFHPKTNRALVDHMRVSGDISHAPECWNFRPIKSERDELFYDAAKVIENAHKEKNRSYGSAQNEITINALIDAGWRPE